MIPQGKRENIIQQVVANARLSGLTPPPSFFEDADLWVREEITVDEMIERAKKRYEK